MSSIHVDLLGSETRFVDTGRYRSRVITVDNDKIPLILLHGGGGHAETWARNIMRLSQVCRPIAVDFIWHGLSSAPPFSDKGPDEAGNWLDQFTDQILDLMDHMGIEKAVIEGESLGGWIAYDMAVNHPDRTAGVVLNTTWGMSLDPAHVHEGGGDLVALRETSLNALRHPTPELLRKRLEWLMPLGGVTDELVDVRHAIWTRPQTNAALIEYYERLFAPNIAEFYFTEAEIRTIGCPTLVLWTDSNPIHGPDAAHRLSDIIAGARLHIMQGCAHWPQWERPEEHDAAVADFLSGLTNPSSSNKMPQEELVK